MTTWKEKLDYILSQTEDIHRFYDSVEGWCWLTDRTATRYKITEDTPIERIDDIIAQIKKVNNRE